MCDGISEAALIGLAVSAVATAGSVAAQQQASNQAEKARNSAINDEMLRQDALQKEAQRNLASTTDEFSQANQNKQVVDAANKREATYQAAIPQTAGVETFGLQRGQPKVVGDTFARADANSTDRTMDYAKRLALLNAFGDSNFKNNINLLNNQQNLNMLAGFSNASNGLLPGELANAANAGQGWKFASDIFGGIGSVAGAYGLSQPKVGGKTMPASFAVP